MREDIKMNKIQEVVLEPSKIYVGSSFLLKVKSINFINYIFIPHYESNYHKVNLIQEVVEKCKIENKKFRAVRDGEVIIQ